MKKVKHILTIFIHSFVPQDIYFPKLLHTRFSLSVKYYICIVSFFACIYTGIVVWKLSPVQMFSYKNSILQSLSSFPDGLVLSINKGALESNLNKPLFLWVYQNSQPLFVFMAHTKDIVTKFDGPIPFIFLGVDKAQFSYRGFTIIKPYMYSWDIVITKDRIQTFVDTINSMFPAFVFFFYLFLIILLPLLFIIGATFLIVCSSTIVYILLRTFIPHIHFKKCIQAGLHGTHIPLLIVLLLFGLFPYASNSGAIALALIFVFSLVSTYEMYSKEVSYRSGR